MEQSRSQGETVVDSPQVDCNAKNEKKEVYIEQQQ